MSYTNQLETSIKTPDHKNNFAENADLDDKLINQALSIYQHAQMESKPGAASLTTDQNNIRDAILQSLERPCQPTNNVLRNSLTDTMKDVLINEAIRDLSRPFDRLPPAIRCHPESGDTSKGKIAETINRLFDIPHEGPSVLRRNQNYDKVPSDITDGLIQKPLDRRSEQDRSKDRNQSETHEQFDWNEMRKYLEKQPEGFYLCTAKIPPKFKEEFNKPSEIFACSYRVPPAETLPKFDKLYPGAPNDTILCSEKIPRSGVKPEPGNYYACVYYYPLKPENLKIQC